MRKKRERGAVMVEFALILPLLLLLVLGLIEFGNRYKTAAVLNNAAFIAARDFSVHGSYAQAKSAAQAANGGVVPPGFPASLAACPTDPTVTGNVSVIFDSTGQSVTKLFGTTYTVHVKGVARCEN